MNKGGGFYTSWVASPVLSAGLIFHPIGPSGLYRTRVCLFDDQDRPGAGLDKSLGALLPPGVHGRRDGKALTQRLLSQYITGAAIRISLVACSNDGTAESGPGLVVGGVEITVTFILTGVGVGSISGESQDVAQQCGLTQVSFPGG